MPTVRLPELDTSGHDSPIVEFVDRLNGEAQRQFVERSRRVQRIDGFDHDRTAVPADLGGSLGDAVSIARRDWNDCCRNETEAGQVCGNFVSNGAEAFRAEIDAVHLVDDDSDLFDAEQMQQIAVPPRLVAHAFQRVDDEHCAVGLCRAGDHVTQKFGMAGSVDQHYVARARTETDLRGIDGDALIPLGLQGVQQERPFERHAASGADRFQHLKFAVGQAAGLVQQPPDQR